MWETIPDFSRYEISTQGEIRHRRHKRILKEQKPHNGYLQVRIHNDALGRTLSKCIHQLMALTFMGEKPPKHEVAHKDNIKKHNKLSNLKYLYWRKNRIPKTRPITYCFVCGKENPKGNKRFCDKNHRWLGSRTLIQCAYCGRWRYRIKSELKARTPERGYVNGQTFCSYRCTGLNRSMAA